MKKWLAIVVSVLLLATMIPMGAVSVSAAYDFLFPVNNGGVIAYAYGYSASYGSSFHTGVDIHSYGDDTIYAAAGGTVVAVYNGCSHVSDPYAACNPPHDKTYGNYVKVLNDNGTYAIYGHMVQNSIRVAVNETVVRGQALGTMGSSGMSTGKHLHFEVRLSDNKTTVNTNHGGDVVYSTTGYNGTPAAPSVKLPDPICKPVREETFMIKNAAYPYLFLNVYAGKDANATKVVAWEIDLATQDQQFAMEYLGDGSYYLRAAGLTNRVLDIYWGSNGVVDYGDTLQVWTKGEYDETTIFNVVPVGANKYAIELKSLDNAVLTITGGSNDSAIGLYDYIANEAQHWYFCDLSGNIADPYAGDHHTWDNGVPTTPATCVNTGVMTYTCTTCGLEDYHTIPVNADAHSYDTYVYYWEAHPHYKCYQCSSCGEVKENKAEPMYIETCDICNKPCEHTYDNACDVDCNACGEIREVGDHVYDNACDADCNVCGSIREVGDHVYDDANDTTCNECGAVRQIAAQVLSYGGSSISEEVNGLAFTFHAAVADAQVTDDGVYDNGSATVTPFVDGDSYNVVRMGAIVSNEQGITLDLEQVNGASTIAIEARYLWDVAEDECSFAIRVIDIPDESKDTVVTARPYYVYEVDGEEIVVYGESVSKTYNEVLQ